MDPITNLFEAIHPKFVLFHGLIEPFKVQNGSEFARTTGIGDSKVRGDKLTLNRVNRNNGLLSKEVSSFLHQHLMGRARDLRIPRPGALDWDELEGNLISPRHNIQDLVGITDLLPILDAESQPAA